MIAPARTHICQSATPSRPIGSARVAFAGGFGASLVHGCDPNSSEAMDRERAWNRVRGLEPMSLCDWPGRQSCVLFLGGCNLRCPTCHNFELAWDMESLPRISRRGALAFLNERKTWLDGVTVTGGEPTVVPGLPALLREIRAFGLPVKVDTNGMLPQVVENLLAEGLADLFAVDVKGPWSKYPALTGNGVGAKVAADNLEHIFRLASARPDSFYFRITQAPAISATDIETVRGYLPAGFDLAVQRYKPPRRNNAPANPEEGRPSRDLVQRAHRSSHSESPERERDQGSHSLQAALQEG